MACKYSNNCGKLCSHFVVTTAVAIVDGAVVLTLPDNVTYSNCEKYCIVIGQTLPDATINSPVVAVIGDGAEQFPLLTCSGAPVVVQQIATRRIYPVRVRTSATSGTLIVLRQLSAVDSVALNSLNEAGGGA